MSPPRIEEYRYGRIVIDGKAYEQDVLILPEEVRIGWRKRKGKKKETLKETLTRSDIASLLLEQPEVLLIGLGAGAHFGLTAKAIASLEEAGIEWRALPTKDACKAYNHLADQHRVVAVLHIMS